MPRLQQQYRERIVPELLKSLALSNTMQVPRITKITINMGVGEAVADKKVIDAAVADLARISGQKPAVTRARKSVATFKVRDGQAIGCKVTLRGARMYEFLDRLVSIAMPRIRDFRGDIIKAHQSAGFIYHSEVVIRKDPVSAMQRTKAIGFQWHVDHIVPLQSPIVCGLHTIENLQVIPGALNLAKGNRMWPQMPRGR